MRGVNCWAVSETASSVFCCGWIVGECGRTQRLKKGKRKREIVLLHTEQEIPWEIDCFVHSANTQCLWASLRHFLLYDWFSPLKGERSYKGVTPLARSFVCVCVPASALPGQEPPHCPPRYTPASNLQSSLQYKNSTFSPAQHLSPFWTTSQDYVQSLCCLVSELDEFLLHLMPYCPFSIGNVACGFSKNLKKRLTSHNTWRLLWREKLNAKDGVWLHFNPQNISTFMAESMSEI